MKRIIACLTIALCGAAAHAISPKPTWEVDFASVFDNREGDADITPAKTYFFTRLAPEIGLKFSESDRIAGGVVWFQPIGCEWEGHRLSPTLYYRHEGKRWRFSMGMFPRKQLVEEMPGYLWSDSLSYYQTNIRGALVQYAGDKGFFDAYVDWRGMQTSTQREAFNIVFHGQMSPRRNWFGFGGYVQMNHFALQKNAPEGQGIVDHFVVNPYLMADLGRHTALDSLNIRVGVLATAERNRAISRGWHVPAGFYMEAVGEWKWLGAKNTLYAGGQQMRSYGTLSPMRGDGDGGEEAAVWAPMGPSLYQGEAFYQKKFYDRLDIYAYILRKKHVSLLASLDFNFTPGAMIFYQRLMLRVTLP